MSYLEKLLHQLAEMYKLMGLWVLALGLYLDAGDMVLSLLGYENDHGISAMGYVTSCLRKMHLPVLARGYLSHVCKQIEDQSRDPSKAAVGRKILDKDRCGVYDCLALYSTVSDVYYACKYRELVQIKLKADEIWGMLKTEMPNQDLKKRAYFLHGLGSLFNLMIATEGYAVGAKATFIQHCLDSDPHGMGKFAEFASYCFRLRVCDNELVRIA